MTNLEKLYALGAENCHPAVIHGEREHRTVVGAFVDGELHLTPAGIALLANSEPKAASKKVAKKVESANIVADEVDDLNLEG